MRCLQAFDCQWYPLPTQEWLSVAGFTERFSQLANGLWPISALAPQWGVASGLDGLSEKGAYQAKKKRIPVYY
jgi:hypothetical protein